MSRIGKSPINIPEGVSVNLTDKLITVTGGKGTLSYQVNNNINVTVEDNQVLITRDSDDRDIRALHGLTRALINNMVVGVTEGFKKVLHIIGTGYSAENVGPWLKLSIGYSHDILMEIPESLTVKAEAVPRSRGAKNQVQSIITVEGIRKDEVGGFAAEVRKCRKPENYKGKGIRYADEFVVIKPGKSGAKG